jgi:CheY-like chemotaxis protein
MATMALMDSRDVVNWLQHIEEQVGRLYASAATLCAEDADFASFLARLAEDEESHAQFMSMVLANLQKAERRPALDIVLDQDATDRIERPLKRFEQLLAGKSITKKQVVEYMARAESSELNPVFLYVVDKFGRAGREGERMTGEIQAHLSRIEAFVEALPRDLRPSIDISTLPRVAEKRFLVIGDDEPLRRLVTSLLARRGAVDTAAEGREGLHKLREHFHDSIISDVQMPGMDALEFHRQAVEYDPHLRGRFLFYATDITPERAGFLKENRLCFLQKPFGLTEFLNAIDRILRGDTQAPADPVR